MPDTTATAKGFVDQRLANLRPAATLTATCAGCAHYEPEWNGCEVVAGSGIRPDYVCDVFTATTLASALADAEDEYAMKADPNEFTVVKADDAEQLVFGWAYVSQRPDGTQVVDHSGEMVDPATLEKAAYGFVVESREGGDSHAGDPVATMVESVVFTPEKVAKLGLPPGSLPAGWWVGFHVPDPDVYALVKSGDRAMFSIEGSCIREDVTP